MAGFLVLWLGMSIELGYFWWAIRSVVVLDDRLLFTCIKYR